MKKIVSYVLMIVFTINVACFASETIASVSEKNVSIKTNKIEASKKEDKKEIETKNIEEHSDLLKKYHKEYVKHLKKTNYYHVIFYLNNLDGYEHYNYPSKDNFDKNDKNILRFELQDGDYALLNLNIEGDKKYKYAAEYHKNGELFGIVQIRTIKKKRDSAIMVFHEYRKVGERKYQEEHTVFFEIKKSKKAYDFAQFIYKAGVDFENLYCAQIGNDVYLNKDSKNLLIKMQKFNVPEKSFISDKTKDNIEKGTESALDGVMMVLTFPVMGFLVAGIFIYLFFVMA